MATSFEHPHDAAWFDLRIESYIDGELPEAERALFAERLLHDAELRRQVALAERVSLSLAAVERPLCSEEMVARVEAISQGVSGSGSGMRILSQRSPRVTPLRLLRWPVGIAACAALSLMVIRGIGGFPETTDTVLDPASETYTQAEIDAALVEAKFALAVVSDAGRHAGTTVREAVIQRHLVRPVNTKLENTVFGARAPTN